jgi:hypothetical protein
MGCSSNVSRNINRSSFYDLIAITYAHCIVAIFDVQRFETKKNS